MSYLRDDTVAAIATSPNAVAAVGIIRISGPSAWKKVSSLLRKPGGRAFDLERVESHRLYRCLVTNAKGEPLDDGMFCWMKAPHSFTGEEVVELNLHGSPLLLQRVMKALHDQGLREALPGEFSFRAFRNGKLSLDQAESVADLISSQSEEASRRALDALIGRGKSELDRLKRVLVDRLAEIEIDIDFSDQGVSVLEYDRWCASLKDWVRRVDYLREEFLQSRPLREGIRLALVGSPNSGKSSIFNCLLGEDRSIVSDEAGTTRDVVRETLRLKEMLFRVSDTAGIRATESAVEAAGIDRSFGELREAQAVVWVFDGANESSLDLALRYAQIRSHLVAEAKVVAVWNKADLQAMPEVKWSEFFRGHGIPVVVVSAKESAGIPALVNALVSLFHKEPPEAGQFSLNRWRHFEVLGAAKEAVLAALGRVEAGEKYPDLLAADLRTALGKVGEITGEFSSEDLLNHIFAEFCIGK